MRIARRYAIRDSGIFHKMWRGHNREHVLASRTDKLSYLSSLRITLTAAIVPFVVWHSYCLMGNHAHETGRLLLKKRMRRCLKALGDWMRNAHSRFGMAYNRRNHRQGKVAYDRPKTKEIDAKGGLLQVMFYGDANPVAAGMVSHPSRYPYSSYRYYAYGKKDETTETLTEPPEYVALGSTPGERQKKYRELCDAYLREVGLLNDKPPEGADLATIEAEDVASKIAASIRGDPIPF